MVSNTKTISDIDTRLLSIVRDFLTEYKTQRALSTLSLGSSLDKDLGIDSLGRVELFHRIEKTFGIAFQESFIAQADTIQDIVTAIQTAHPEKSEFTREFVTGLEESRFDPSALTSLVDVLLRHASIDPNRPHVYLMDEKGDENIIRYGALLECSRKVAAGLLELGLQKEETVAIMLPTSESFFYAFFGVLLAGGIPVPIYPPVRPDKIEEYALREAAILNNAEVRILITFTQVEALSRLLQVFINSLRAVTTVEMLMKSKHKVPHIVAHQDDSAMIQYTSGSTAAPKGVLLTHANLLANIRSVCKAANITPKDVGVSWLPLYHDMGLIGAWFCSLYQGIPLTLMSPLTFLNRPERWLWAIHYHRGTLSAGPNFAYELCIRRIKDEDIVGLDLSSWRLAFNGAEPINPRTLEGFIKKFAPYGFRAESLYPVYGLAECSVAVSFPPLNRKPLIDVIKRDVFEKEGRAIPVETKDNNFLEFVCCGQPIPDHDFRIVDENRQELPERHVGLLQFYGPSAMQGYFRNSEATNAIYHEGWWDSGDFAYIANGEVYITGRQKDIIIKGGRNLYPQEIEEAAAQVSGVRKGCVVAFGVEDVKWGTEKLVVVAETAETNKKHQETMEDEILEKVSLIVGVPPDEVRMVVPRTIPKTSSGKLQRAATKKMFLEGKLSKRGTPVWIQMTKLVIRGAGLTLWGYLQKFGRFLYTFYIGLLLVLFIPLLFISLIFPKGIAITLFHFLIQIFIFFSGIRLKVSGRENLNPKLPAIYVANHASYADSVILLGVLPKNILIVGKKELRSWPFVKWVLKKFSYPTVDRSDFSKSLEDTQIIADKLSSGHSILIYPEGTFTYATGLRPFKMGAFKIAVDTGTRIIPVALKGTRSLLRARSFILSPSVVKVTISPSIRPEGKDWEEATKLHSQVRAVIAKHCGELETRY